MGSAGTSQLAEVWPQIASHALEISHEIVVVKVFLLKFHKAVGYNVASCHFFFSDARPDQQKKVFCFCRAQVPKKHILWRFLVNFWRQRGNCPKICIKYRKHGSSSFSRTFNCVCFSLFYPKMKYFPNLSKTYFTFMLCNFNLTLKYL